MPQAPATSFADDLATVRGTGLDAHGHPADDFASDLAAVRSTSAAGDPRSLLARAVDAARTPLVTFPSTLARKGAEILTDPRLSGTVTEQAIQGALLPTFLQGHVSGEQTRGFAGGVLQGAGDTVSGMTSPLDLALLL